MKMDHGKKMTDRKSNYKKHIMPLEDGFYYWWPTHGVGALTSNNLREIADLLDDINEPWEEQIKEYFATNTEHV